MAFAVNFYAITKRRNSTALPAGTATVLNCTAKGPLEIHNPVISVQFDTKAAYNPVTFNYAYIPTLARYYWIDAWTNEGPLWTASMTVDVLATFRSGINSSTIYVTRSFSQSDGRLRDDMYPMIAGESYSSKTFSGAEPFFRDFSESEKYGFYVLGISSKDSVNYYQLTPAKLAALLDYVYSDTYYDDAVSALSIDMYPETKIAVDPMQYILSCVYYPALCLPGYTAGAFRRAADAQTIWVGLVETTVSAPMMNSQYSAVHPYGVVDHMMISYQLSNMPSDFWHPQASFRGIYLNSEPYSVYEVRVPGFGYVPINALDLEANDTITLNYYTDCRNGSCILDISMSDSLNQTSVAIGRLSGSCGVELPLSRTMVTGSTALSVGRAAAGGILQGIAGALSGNVISAISGAVSAFNSAVKSVGEGATPHLSTTASSGNLSELVGPVILTAKHILIADENDIDWGRPLCTNIQLSHLTGFVKGNAEGISITGATLQELDEIISKISEGIYLA